MRKRRDAEGWRRRVKVRRGYRGLNPAPSSERAHNECKDEDAGRGSDAAQPGHGLVSGSKAGTAKAPDPAPDPAMFRSELAQRFYREIDRRLNVIETHSDVSLGAGGERVTRMLTNLLRAYERVQSQEAQAANALAGEAMTGKHGKEGEEEQRDAERWRNEIAERIEALLRDETRRETGS